jgi:hypothetical protein
MSTAGEVGAELVRHGLVQSRHGEEQAAITLEVLRPVVSFNPEPDTPGPYRQVMRETDKRKRKRLAT